MTKKPNQTKKFLTQKHKTADISKLPTYLWS